MNQLKSMDLKNKHQRDAFTTLLAGPNNAMTEQEKADAIKALAVPEKVIHLTQGMKDHDDTAAARATKHFEQVTAVKDVVDKHMAPIMGQFRALFNQAQSQRSSYHEYQQKLRDMHMEIKMMNDRFECLAAMRSQLNGYQDELNSTQQQFEGLKSTCEINIAALKAQDVAIDAQFKTQNNRQDEQDQRYLELKNIFNAEHINQVQYLTAKDAEYQRQLYNTNHKLGELETKLDTTTELYSEFSAKIQKTVDKCIEKTFEKMNKQIARLDKQEALKKQVDEMEKKTEALFPQVAQLMQEMRTVTGVPSFLEHALPFWMLYETTEALRDIFGKTPAGRSGYTSGVGSNNQLLKIVNYENRKLQDITRYNAENRQRKLNLFRLTESLQIRGKVFAEAREGCYAPFKLGRDYFAAISNEEMMDTKPALLKDMKDKAAALRSREEGMTHVFEVYDEMMGTNESRYAQMDKFQNYLNKLDPSQLVQMWSYFLTNQVKNQRLELFYENFANKDEQEKLNQRIDFLAEEVKRKSSTPMSNKFPDSSSKPKNKMLNSIGKQLKSRLNIPVSNLESEKDHSQTQQLSPEKVVLNASFNATFNATVGQAGGDPAALTMPHGTSIDTIQPSQQQDTQLATPMREGAEGKDHGSNALPQATPKKPKEATLNNPQQNGDTDITQRDEDGTAELLTVPAVEGHKMGEDSILGTTSTANKPVKNVLPERKLASTSQEESSMLPSQPKVILFQSINSKELRKAHRHHKLIADQFKKHQRQLENKIRRMQRLFPKDILNLEEELEKEIVDIKGMHEKLDKFRTKAEANDIFSQLGVKIKNKVNAKKAEIWLKAPKKRDIHAQEEEEKEEGEDDLEDEKHQKKLFDREIAMMQIENSRPRAEEESLEFDRNQTEKLQEIIDQSINWVQVYLKQAINNHINDQWLQFYDLKKALIQQGKENTDNLQDFCQRVEKYNDDCKQVRAAYVIDHKELYKFKQRMNSDLREDVTKIVGMVNASYENVFRNRRNVELNRQAIDLMLESSMIASLIQSQEIEDRKSLKLFAAKKDSQILGRNQGAEANLGIPGKIQKGLSMANAIKENQERRQQNRLVEKSPISPEQIDNEVKDYANFETDDKEKRFNPLMFGKNCATCTEKNGNTPSLLQQIKDACLCFVQNPVVYRGRSTAVEQLVHMKEALLKQCQHMLKWENSNPQGRVPDEVTLQGQTKFRFNFAATNSEIIEKPTVNLVIDQARTNIILTHDGDTNDYDVSPNAIKTIEMNSRENFPTFDKIQRSKQEMSERDCIQVEMSPIRTSKLDTILDRDLKKVLIKESEQYHEQQKEKMNIIKEQQQSKKETKSSDIKTQEAPNNPSNNASSIDLNKTTVILEKEQGRKTRQISDSFKIQSLITKDIDEGLRQQEVRKKMGFIGSKHSAQVQNTEKKRLDIFLQRQQKVQSQLNDMSYSDILNHERNKFEQLQEFQNQILMQNELLKSMQQEQKEKEMSKNRLSTSLMYSTDQQSQQTSKRGKTGYGSRRKNAQGSIGESVAFDSLLGPSDNIQIEGYELRPLQSSTLHCNDYKTLRQSSQPHVKNMMELDRTRISLDSFRGSQNNMGRYNALGKNKKSIASQRRSIVINQDSDAKRRSMQFPKRRINNDLKMHGRNAFTSLGDYQEKTQQHSKQNLKQSEKASNNKHSVGMGPQAWPLPSTHDGFSITQHSIEIVERNENLKQSERTRQSDRAKQNLMQESSGTVSNADMTVHQIKENKRLEKAEYKVPQPALKAVNITFNTSSKVKEISQASTGKIKFGNTSHISSPKNNDQSKHKGKQQSSFFNESFMSRKLEGTHKLKEQSPNRVDNSAQMDQHVLNGIAEQALQASHSQKQQEELMLKNIEELQLQIEGGPSKMNDSLETDLELGKSVEQEIASACGLQQISTIVGGRYAGLEHVETESPEPDAPENQEDDFEAKNVYSQTNF